MPTKKELAKVACIYEGKTFREIELQFNEEVTRFGGCKMTEKTPAEIAARDKLFLTEILNDLHRYGYVPGGKADSLLRDWSRELRELARPVLPPSRLKKTFALKIGICNW